MRLLVDGHNLIGQMPDIRLDDPHDEAKLAMQIKRFCMRHRHHCTIVFDNGVPGGLSRLSNSQVTVIFAPPGTPADRLLIARIRRASDPASLVVVTSDRAIIAEAQNRKMRVIRSSDFVQILYTPTRAPVEDEDTNPVITAEEVAYWLVIFGESLPDSPEIPEKTASAAPAKAAKKIAPPPKKRRRKR